MIWPLPDRLKAAYTTRHVPLEAIHAIGGDGALVPAPGDLVVASVTELGQHKRLELRNGRRAALYPGDRILVAYGNRYAPDQFEAVVPARLSPCSLVAAGGIAGEVLCRHQKMSDATAISPLGLCVDARGERLNLASFAAPAPAGSRRPPLVIGIVGSSMNAGKTTTAGFLVRGLTAAGLRVGACKVTGTGAGGDAWFLADAGAHPVLDFTDVGHATTAKLAPDHVVSIAEELVARVGAAGVDVAIVEVADGLLQRETTALLTSEPFKTLIDRVVFAAGDALSVASGVAWLRAAGLEPVAVSGVVSSSPLAAREATAACGLPVLGTSVLEDAVAAAAVARGDAESALARGEELAALEAGKRAEAALIEASEPAAQAARALAAVAA